MFRIITYEVPVLSAPVRISTFLRRLGFSRQNLIELKKLPGPVLVNGEERFFNERIRGGETLTVRIPVDDDPDMPEADLPFGIVYEDDDLIVVDKPAGMPIHPSFRNRENTLANALAWYFHQKDTPFVFRCSNRLDRDTSGLTVAAKHIVSANILSVMGTQRRIEREYLGIVRGIPSPADGIIDAPLGRVPGSVLMRQVDLEHGEKAVTRYKTLSVFSSSAQDLRGVCHDGNTNSTKKDGYSLLLLTLETGRTHQIRVHMKYAGFPLIGDYLYNPDFEIMHRQALHCRRLRFPHPMSGEIMTFEAPVPEDMQTALKILENLNSHQERSSKGTGITME